MQVAQNRPVVLAEVMAERCPQWADSPALCDIAPVLASIVAAGGARGEITLPAMKLLAATTMPDLSGWKLRSPGSQAAVIRVTNPTGSVLRFSGANGRTGGGVEGVSLLLDTPASRLTSAKALHLEGNAQFQPDQMVFKDLYISSIGDCFWSSALYAHGVARTGPQGIRAVSMENVQLFRSHYVAAWLANVVQWTINNIGVYAGATQLGNSFYIAGGGTPGTNSKQVWATGLVATDLNLTNTTVMDLRVSVSRLLTMANADEGEVSGVIGQVLGAPGPRLSLRRF